jgi:hypothetical protein
MKFRPDAELAHDDLLDAVGDLDEYRQTPYKPAATPFTDDPEIAERITFERELSARNPNLDAMSLRVAYLHHRHTQQGALQQESLALNASGGTDVLWGM